MGNEGHGLTEAQIAVCDHFVYIPQAASTASVWYCASKYAGQ